MLACDADFLPEFGKSHLREWNCLFQFLEALLVCLKGCRCIVKSLLEHPVSGGSILTSLGHLAQGFVHSPDSGGFLLNGLLQIQHFLSGLIAIDNYVEIEDLAFDFTHNIDIMGTKIAARRRLIKDKGEGLKSSGFPTRSQAP